jgi:hypothetical protein
MPKNKVTTPITDREMAFVHLVLSGSMNDRRAAQAVGLNPENAAYTKSKPRVQAYMAEHRAAVREKIVREESEGLRKLNLGRDRILTRLWELAALSAEATRGSITGQMKALAMIAAIEGFIPDRRHSHAGKQAVTMPCNAQTGDSAWRSEDRPAAAGQSADPPASAPTKPVAPPVPEPPLAHNAGQFNPFVISQPLNRVPASAASFFDIALEVINSANQPYSAKPSEFVYNR